jgi:rhodanese-related sulfurtransferase
MKNSTQEEWNTRILKDKNAVIIDVRRPDEWANGVIANALLLNVLDTVNFTKAMSKLDKDKNYYVYCRSGRRSVTACMMLEQHGIQNTYNLLGGFLDWEGTTVSTLKKE